MVNPFDPTDERSWLGQKVAVITVLLLALGGWLITRTEASRIVDARAGFERGEFQVLHLLECDPKAEAAFLVDPVQGKPVAASDEEDASHEIFAFNGRNVPGLPRPRFVQKHTNKLVKLTSFSILYEVFRAPNAIAKAKNWAKANAYSNWDFQLKWAHEQHYGGEPVAFSKKGSNVIFTAFFESKGRLYLWETGDGQVLDLSEGLTSRAGGRSGERYYRRLVERLEGIAR
jgi:hypothetical protein